MFPTEVSRRAAIFGANSSVGVEVCNSYLAAGHSVRALYKQDSSTSSVLATSSGLEAVQCDLADLDPVGGPANANADTDFLIFLASIATPSHLEHLDVPLERTLAIGALSN